MRTFLLLPLLAAAFAQPANAYTVMAPVACSEVLASETADAVDSPHVWWLLGYMTARNYVEDASSGEGMPEGVIYGMALQFCADNPGADLDDAGQFIFEGLK